MTESQRIQKILSPVCTWQGLSEKIAGKAGLIRGTGQIPVKYHPPLLRICEAVEGLTNYENELIEALEATSPENELKDAVKLASSWQWLKTAYANYRSTGLNQYWLSFRYAKAMNHVKKPPFSAVGLSLAVLAKVKRSAAYVYGILVFTSHPYHILLVSVDDSTKIEWEGDIKEVEFIEYEKPEKPEKPEKL